MLKKLSLIALFVILPFCAQSQEKEDDKPSKFGFTAGYIDSQLDKSRWNYAPDDRFDPIEELSGNGLFLGLTNDTEFNEKFSLSSEVIWARIQGVDQFRLSTLLKYSLFSSKFHIMAGPELNYIPSKLFDYMGDDYGNEVGINLTGGLEYDINSRISVYGKYSYELTDRYKSGIYEKQYDGGFNGFRLGLKFKF